MREGARRPCRPRLNVQERPRPHGQPIGWRDVPGTWVFAHYAAAHGSRSSTSRPPDQRRGLANTTPIMKAIPSAANGAWRTALTRTSSGMPGSRPASMASLTAPVAVLIPSAIFAAVLGSSGSRTKSSVMALPFRCMRQRAGQRSVPIRAKETGWQSACQRPQCRTVLCLREGEIAHGGGHRSRGRGYQDGVRDAVGHAFLAISPLPATAKSHDIGDSACPRVQWHKTERHRLYMFH